MSAGPDNTQLSVTAIGTIQNTNPIQTDLTISISVGKYIFFTQVSTCTSAANAITLPIAPFFNKSYVIKNDGAAALKVFPAQGTTSGATATINGGTINAAVMVQPGETVAFVAADSIANGASVAATTGYAWFTREGKAPALPVNTLTALAGGAQPTLAANLIDAREYYTIVGTVATALDSIALPDAPKLQVPYVVYNDAAVTCTIFAGQTATASTINGVAQTSPAFLGGKASVMFTAVKNTAGVVAWLMHGYSGPRPVIPMPLTAAATLTNHHHDSICTIGVITANRTYTLPPVATPGFRVKFTATAPIAGGFLWTIAAQSASLYGRLFTGKPAAVTTEAKQIVMPVGASTSITAVAAGLAGDWVDFVTDGAKWNTFGYSNYNAADTAMFTLA